MTNQSKNRMGSSFWIAILVFIIYLAILAKLTLFRSPLNEVMESWTYYTVVCKVRTANFIPLRTIKMYIRMLPSSIAMLNLFGNVVGFIPLGFLPPFIFEHKTKFSRTVIFGFLIILFIELTQLITGIGEFDVDDILLNMVGVIVGRASFWILNKIKK